MSGVMVCWFSMRSSSTSRSMFQIRFFQLIIIEPSSSRKIFHSSKDVTGRKRTKSVIAFSNTWIIFMRSPKEILFCWSLTFTISTWAFSRAAKSSRRSEKLQESSWVNSAVNKEMAMTSLNLVHISRHIPTNPFSSWKTICVTQSTNSEKILTRKLAKLWLKKARKSLSWTTWSSTASKVFQLSYRKTCATSWDASCWSSSAVICSWKCGTCKTRLKLN